MTQVAVYNRASVPLGLDLSRLVEAMQLFLDHHFAPAWGLSADLSVTSGPVPGSFSMVFLDDADAPGALAYHDEESGAPLAKVFVKTIAAAGESLSVSASHELVEMLADPCANLYAIGPSGQPLYAYEVADAVEDDSLSIEVAGFAMSDFVLPAWFDATALARPGARFDHRGVLSRPFELHPKGYAIELSEGQFREVFGSEEKASRFAMEDRRGHRSEHRKRLLRGI
jgi:hypothetical protein